MTFMTFNSRKKVNAVPSLYSVLAFHIKLQTPDSYQLRSAHYPPLVTATGFFRFSITLTGTSYFYNKCLFVFGYGSGKCYACKTSKVFINIVYFMYYLNKISHFSFLYSSNYSSITFFL